MSMCWKTGQRVSWKLQTNQQSIILSLKLWFQQGKTKQRLRDVTKGSRKPKTNHQSKEKQVGGGGAKMLQLPGNYQNATVLSIWSSFWLEADRKWPRIQESSIPLALGIFSTVTWETIFCLLKGCSGEWIINVCKLYSVVELYCCKNHIPC